MSQVSNPVDRAKIKKMLGEVSNSMTRIEAERDLIREIVKDQSQQLQIPKKIISKIAKTYHKQSLTQDIQDHEDFVELYDKVTK